MSAYNLMMSPVEGEFEVAAIRGYLDAQPDMCRDPLGSDIYIVCGGPEAVQSAWEARKNHPDRFPYEVLIEVLSDLVTLVMEFGDEDNLRTALEFARWMWSRGNIVLHDAYNCDVTEQARSEGIESFYPAYLRDRPMPWAGRLIKVGFFWELDSGLGPSLAENRADTAHPDEERIAAYLDAGLLLERSSEIANDWFADVPDVEVGPAHVLTDGTYAWRADLSYYVRRYHVRVPEHFVLHLRRNEFRIPPDVDLASLKLEP